jgi:hypothetical protein
MTRRKAIEVDEDVFSSDAELTEQMRLKFKAEWEKRDMDRHFATDDRSEFSQEAFLKDALAIFGKL